MSEKVRTAQRVISSLGLIDLDVVVGDLIEAAFKADTSHEADDEKFVSARIAANKNKIRATYDEGVGEVFCADEQVRKLLQDRVDRIKVLRVGSMMTFSAPR